MSIYRTHSPRRSIAIGLGAVLALTLSLSGGLNANAAAGTVGDPDFLGAAGNLAVLGAEGVSNTGPSVIDGPAGVGGNIAIEPGPSTAVTGFGPPATFSGTIYSPPDLPATQGRRDASDAYDALEAMGATAVPTNLGGYEYGPGVYHGAPASNTLEINGTLVLNGTATDIFVFQTSSTLITGSASVVELRGGAQACNVFWQVGSSATLGTGSTLVGTVVARISVTATTGAKVEAGRLLALDGAVTLDTNTITTPPTCATATGGSTPGGSGTLTPEGAAAEAAAAAARAAAEAAAAEAARAAAADAARAAAAAAASGTAAAELAATGADPVAPLAIAAFAILLGTALLFRTRGRGLRSRR